MGQSLKKLAPGEENWAKEIDPVIESCYDKYLLDSGSADGLSLADFYRAVSETIGEINKKLGSTQFRVPKKETLERVYEEHFKDKGKSSLTIEEFKKILQKVIFETGFFGTGARDMFLYIFGVPAAALFVKQGIMPKALPNEIFIPAITSATVFVLAIVNKI